MKLSVSLLILVAAVSAFAPLEAQEILLFPGQTAKTDTALEVGMFAISLADATTVYGVAGDGLVVSPDGGVRWFPLTAPEYVVEIGGIEVSDVDPSRLWMSRSNLLWRSDDSGFSWVQLSSPSVWSVSAIETAPDGDLFVATTGNGVFFSNSGGDVWQSRSTGLPAGVGAEPIIEIEDLLISPTDPDTVFVLTRFLGVFKSDDEGRNWEARNNGLPVPLLLPTVEKGSLAVDSSSPDVLLLTMTVPIHTHKSMRSIYESSDGGDSWLLVESNEVNGN